MSNGVAGEVYSLFHKGVAFDVILVRSLALESEVC